MKDSNKLLPMNLQFFAEEGSTDDGGHEQPDRSDEANSESEDVKDDGKNQEPERTFTQDEVDKLIAEKLDEAKQKSNEEEELSKMNETQKLQHKLEKAEKKSSDTQKELSRYRMRDTARDMAKSSGITLEEDDINHIVTPEADSTKTNIDWLTKYTNRITQNVKNDLAIGSPMKKTGQTVNAESRGTKLAKQNSTNTANPYFK